MDRRPGFRLQSHRLRAIVAHGVVSTGAQTPASFGFQSPGDYATCNSNHTPEGTPTLVFILNQKGRDSPIFQTQDGYNRRDSEQQQVTGEKDPGRPVRRPWGAVKSFLPGDKRKLSRLGYDF